MHVLPRLVAASIAVGFGLGASISANAAQGLEGVPAYDHVGVLVLENESFSSTWGSGSPATYLNSLVPSGAFADMYFADGHVSLDNYITMTSGQPGNPATYSDCETENLYTCSRTTLAFANGANIADQVETANLSWKGYEDSAKSACFHGDTSPAATPPDPYQGDGQGDAAYMGNYADRHNPFIYYPDILDNNARCAAHVMPYAQLASDITGNTVPNYFFITPDTCHDGHDSPCAGASTGGLISADAWLQSNLPSLITYLNAHNGVLLITFDEGATTDTKGCCTGGPGGAMGAGGRVGLLALGANVAAGTTTHHSYDHASLLRTTEDALGIGTYLNNASTATAMSDLFSNPAANAPETPWVVVLPLVGAAALLAGRRRVKRP